MSRRSNADTWTSNELPVPAPFQDVLIKNTMYVMLDVSPEPVGELTIQGKLEFHRLDLVLDARAIVVTGILEVEAL